MTSQSCIVLCSRKDYHLALDLLMITVRRASVIAFAMLTMAAPLAVRLAAQQRDSAAAARTTLISGVVYDSIARAPLAGASVQLVAADRSRAAAFSAITDSAGRFTIPAVVVGDYMIGFFHPMLDSLGIDQIVHRVSARAA